MEKDSLFFSTRTGVQVLVVDRFISQRLRLVFNLFAFTDLSNLFPFHQGLSISTPESCKISMPKTNSRETHIALLYIP